MVITADVSHATAGMQPHVLVALLRIHLFIMLQLCVLWHKQVVSPTRPAVSCPMILLCSCYVLLQMVRCKRCDDCDGISTFPHVFIRLLHAIQISPHCCPTFLMPADWSSVMLCTKFAGLYSQLLLAVPLPVDSMAFSALLAQK